MTPCSIQLLDVGMGKECSTHPMHALAQPFLSCRMAMKVISSRYNEAGLQSVAVDGYKKPQLVRGWERGLIRFIIARISGVAPLYLWYCSEQSLYDSAWHIGSLTYDLQLDSSIMQAGK